MPRLDDPQLRLRRSSATTGSAPCVPKARLRRSSPARDSALISVRLRPGLSDSQRSEAISLFRQAVADPAFQLQQGGGLRRPPSYVVSGVPVVFDGLAEELSTQIFILLAAALAVMVITLAAGLPAADPAAAAGDRARGAGLMFGFLSLVGGSLTMASIAVLPVLIGLSVDYAIQFQARFLEAARAGSSPPRAAVEAAARGGPVIATAALGDRGRLRGAGAARRSRWCAASRCCWCSGIGIAFALALTVGLRRSPCCPARSSRHRRGPGARRARLAARRRGAPSVAPHPAWGRPSGGALRGRGSSRCADGRGRSARGPGGRPARPRRLDRGARQGAR